MQSAETLKLLSGIVVVAGCLYLIGLAAMIVFRPVLAERFLSSFASSARAHYTEQGIRLLAGVALVNFASFMRFSELFRLFGWLLVITTIGLLLMPWQWHHKFGTWAIPLAIRHQKLLAVGSLALGGVTLYSVSRAVTM